MNPVLREGVQHAELIWMSAVMTVVFFLCFIGWTLWAYAGRNRKRFEEAALLPFTTGGEDA